jgi:hypothetical protein
MFNIFAPILLVGGLAGGGYLWYINTQNTIKDLQMEVQNERKINAAYEVRDAEQKNTIKKLEDEFEKVTTALTNQMERNAEIEAEMSRYLEIFKRHDLAKLAAAKPGLIETRVNKGTKDVFDSIENDSRIINPNSR